MMPETLRVRLWREAEERGAFAVLDGAQSPELLDWLYGPDAPAFECLFTGDLAPDMAEVAPYLVMLEPGSRFTTEFVEQGWQPHWGLLLVSSLKLAPLWRIVRQHTMVNGPQLEPLYFRFYDPRVLRNFLPTCDAKQLAEFFEGIDFLFSEPADDVPAQAWSVADGQLVVEDIGRA